ncbi:MAG: hypothetical protein A2V77_04345 [Anaeromyxobacter sp. RBG_16_69_14]|nr:MAG: hypothetical protein A2V77_04345 [Anaeromyxobacter sp. RBG_16_69_14]
MASDAASSAALEPGEAGSSGAAAPLLLADHQPGRRVLQPDVHHPAPARWTVVRTAAAAALALLGSARALDLSDLDLAVRIWTAPEASRSNQDSPFAPAARLAGLGGERGRGEADLRVRHGGLGAEMSARSTARRGEELRTSGLVNELFYEADLLGQHFTIGKKVASWDVGFGLRPLDVVQQADRRALHPFALEGVPLVTWELFGESWAVTLLYANPLRGRAPAPRDDESVALHYYQRLGSADLHAVGRYSRRTRLQAGASTAVVLGDALELHASSRYQRHGERFAMPASLAGGAPLAASEPRATTASADVLAALLGFTLTPGLGLSVVGEAWLDPAGGTAGEWSALGALAERQRALLGDPAVPSAAVLANLAWELRAFDRPSLLRENLFLRVSWKKDRFEPTADVLYTPADGGFVATAAVAYQGERTRLDGGLRLFGGRAGSAYRLFPESAILYAALQVFF